MPTSSASITAQLNQWTVYGPIAQPPAVDEWLPISLDGASEPPSRFRAGATDHLPLPATAVDGHLDFRALFGAPEGRPQASAFVAFTVDREGTLTLAYTADYFAAIWIDGTEVYSSRGGDQGDQRILVALAPGRHVLNARVITGSRGWSLRVRVVAWEDGVRSELRTDRGAPWRDYRRTLVRYENRPRPDGRCGVFSKEAMEALMLTSGVDARWITTFHDLKGSYVPSAHLPQWDGADPDMDRQVREWVEVLHRHRLCAMTWLPLIVCEEAWQRNPDWRQVWLREPNPNAHDRFACCPNSPYGDALIAYVVEMIERYGFDGVYYDGSFFNPGWNRPLPVGCVCRHCNAAFTAATGLTAPTALDWAQPSFAAWIAWRYDMFAAFWQRLVDGVHARVPEAQIAFNVYHREGGAWQAAIPWQRFGRDFLAATEVDGEPLKALYHTRFLRAYGRPDTEVWMGFTGKHTTPRGAEHHGRKVFDFAVAACTAGGRCAVGSDHAEVEVPNLVRYGDLIRERAPYLDLPSVPFIALHLSQQSESFVFGRNPRYPDDAWDDAYGHSAVGWHHAITHAGLTCEVIFDDHLTSAGLAAHAIIVSPFATALTPAQHAALLARVAAGATLVTGPWFALCDARGVAQVQGERERTPFGDAWPEWTAIERPEERTWVGGGETVVARVPAALTTDRIDLERLLDGPAARRTRHGAGTIIQLGFDLGGLFRRTGARAVVDAVRRVLLAHAQPLVTVDAPGCDVILGIFRRGGEIVVHVQQFAPPWDAAAGKAERPAARWNTVLRGQGAVPCAVRCALPELGPGLPIVGTDTGWSVTMPPFTFGQVVLITLA